MVAVNHTELKPGDICPSCSAGGCQGKLYRVDPGIVIQLHGHSIITGKKYEIETLRCNLCGERFSPPPPKELGDGKKYTPSARAAIAIGRYHLALPWKRIENYQALQNVPVPDASQWDQMVVLYHQVEPVYRLLEDLSSEGNLITYDDTMNRILYPTLINTDVISQIKAINDYQALLSESPKNSSQKAYTTAIISVVDSRPIHLFYTSQECANKKVERLLEQRESDEVCVTMSDASRVNYPTQVPEDLLARWVICFCLVHGRRKFYELYDFFPKEVDFVLEQIAKVYQHEAYCQKQQFSSEDRLKYHQEHSGPEMQALFIWLNNQLLYQQVEPNSGLGKAIRYMLRYWNKLTRFLHCAGAPLDNSWCERAIKIVIRHRRNSLFFRTPAGAVVGDCLMSLIYTAVRNNNNPFEYLVILQQYAKEVRKDPSQWLPWNYKAALLLQQSPEETVKAA